MFNRSTLLVFMGTMLMLLAMAGAAEACSFCKARRAATKPARKVVSVVKRAPKRIAKEVRRTAGRVGKELKRTGKRIGAEAKRTPGNTKKIWKKIRKELKRSGYGETPETLTISTGYVTVQGWDVQTHGNIVSYRPIHMGRLTKDLRYIDLTKVYDFKIRKAGRALAPWGGMRDWYTITYSIVVPKGVSQVTLKPGASNSADKIVRVAPGAKAQANACDPLTVYARTEKDGKVTLSLCGLDENDDLVTTPQVASVAKERVVSVVPAGKFTQSGRTYPAFMVVVRR